MRYTEVDFLVTPTQPWRDILMVELMELGYEGFEETPHGLKAFVPTEAFDRTALPSLVVAKDPHVTLTHSIHEVQDVNWNAKWEREFQPVEVDGRLRVRAEFHPAGEGYDHEIIITPRMAFGTGHHATTRMMVRAMLALDLRGQRVCDLGCGTAVLAILAEKLGAAEVLAIDNDPGAVANALDNVVMNHCERIAVEKGGTDLDPEAGYGTILANIERNTLVHAMKDMTAALALHGRLLLSGFLRTAQQKLKEAAEAAGLEHVLTLEEGEWALSEWEKR